MNIIGPGKGDEKQRKKKQRRLKKKKKARRVWWHANQEKERISKVKE